MKTETEKTSGEKEPVEHSTVSGQKELLAEEEDRCPRCDSGNTYLASPGYGWIGCKECHKLWNPVRRAEPQPEAVAALADKWERDGDAGVYGATYVEALRNCSMDLRLALLSQPQPEATAGVDIQAAAYHFVESMVDRADDMACGVYPLWYGWALREAFEAGFTFAYPQKDFSGSKEAGVVGCAPSESADRRGDGNEPMRVDTNSPAESLTQTDEEKHSG